MRHITLMKKLMAAIVSIGILLNIPIYSFAATSDQVPLSISKPGAGSVTASLGVNVRSTPSTVSNENILTALPYGTNVMIVGRYSSNWYIIQYNTSGSYGYVSRAYVQEYDLDHYCVANATGGTALNLRSSNNMYSNILAVMPNGTAFPEFTYGSVWDYVLYGITEGYVYTSYISRKEY